MINTTTDYERFDFSAFNRPISDPHIKFLKGQIKKQGLLQPLLVTSDGQIVDGQHRFHACRELGVPIQYVVRDGMSMKDVVELNNCAKRWSLLDKVQSYAAQGVEHYVKLMEFYRLCLSVSPNFSVKSASFIAQGAATQTTAAGRKQNLGGGTWEFPDNEDAAMARLEAISKFSQWKFFTQNNFITAFLRCMRTVEGFEHEELLRKAQMNPHVFMHAGTTEEYMRMFERVYNHRKSGRNYKRFF